MTQLGAIKCCKGCVPPERHEGCHSTCEKYQKEKKAHDEYKAKEDAKGDNGAAALVRALPIAIKALEDELKKGESNGYS